VRGRAAPVLLVIAALVYGVRTAVRNLDWVDGRAFYSALVETSPQSAKAQYGFGTQLAADRDDLGAIAAYDRALAILPAYPAALHNRANALARLGRNEEAMESYRACLKYQPGHYGARYNLRRLEQGLPANPPRRPK
ncbi:MAG: tetratricopeptide repeat protein, partial [Myxococcota bacterium]